MSELYSITKKIISQGKGILAADESTATMTKRLDNVNVKSSPENRLLFRGILFPLKVWKTYWSILYDETIRQISSNKKTIPKLIEFNCSTGRKVDTGARF